MLFNLDVAPELLDRPKPRKRRGVSVMMGPSSIYHPVAGDSDPAPNPPDAAQAGIGLASLLP
jgi:hypothetical protein